MMRVPAPNPWCIAHRGARRQAPENTDAAFQLALTHPIDGIELDVQLSADGVAVVFHDRTLYRLTGRRQAVSQCAYAHLKQLRWINPIHPGLRGEPLTSLAQVLERYGGRTRLLIEIKSHPLELASGHSARLTREVLRLLDHHRSRLPDGQIFLLSFDNSLLQLAHRIDPHWPCVLNLASKQPLDPTPRARRRLENRSPAATDHLWGVDAAIGTLSAELVDRAGQLGLRVFTYTCNGPRQLRKALQLQVDAVISDRPGWLTQQLKTSAGL
jgi:glycerophosphoryl diester phosphodiesterase